MRFSQTNPPSMMTAARSSILFSGAAPLLGNQQFVPLPFQAHSRTFLTLKPTLGCSPFFADLEFYDGRQLETRNGSLVITLDKRPFRGMEYASLSLSFSGLSGV